MRVISKLAQIDFKFGRVEREGNVLVVESDPDSKMKTTVYLSPQDVVEYLKRVLLKPFSAPLLYRLADLSLSLEALWSTSGAGDSRRARVANGLELPAAELDLAVPDDDGNVSTPRHALQWRSLRRASVYSG